MIAANPRPFHSVAVLTLALLAVFASPAHADVGVPMLMVVWPAAWLLLIPIILLEAVAAGHILRKSFWSSIKMAGRANLVSTLAGIPMTWFFLLPIAFASFAAHPEKLDTATAKLTAVVSQSPWLLPYQGDLDWMIPAAAAFLCVPFYFMSVWCEYLVARYSLDQTQWPQVRRWAWIGNALSYGLILLLIGTELAITLHKRRFM